jgi:enoyl-CoA hydratase
MMTSYQQNTHIYFALKHHPSSHDSSSTCLFIDVDTSQELKMVFEHFDRESSQSVAVFTGAGGNFCAGYDLQFLSGAENSAELRDTHRLDRGPMGPTHMHLSKPVIAAVEGYAVAGE